MLSLPIGLVVPSTNMTTFCKSVMDLVVKHNFIKISFRIWRTDAIITSRALVGFFVREGKGGGVVLQNMMIDRMHQCTTLNTTGIYKNSFFGKYAHERVLFFSNKSLN
jgi:hypothetical protein